MKGKYTSVEQHVEDSEGAVCVGFHVVRVDIPEEQDNVVVLYEVC